MGGDPLAGGVRARPWTFENFRLLCLVAVGRVNLSLLAVDPGTKEAWMKKKKYTINDANGTKKKRGCLVSGRMCKPIRGAMAKPLFASHEVSRPRVGKLGWSSVAHTREVVSVVIAMVRYMFEENVSSCSSVGTVNNSN